MSQNQDWSNAGDQQWGSGKAAAGASPADNAKVAAILRSPNHHWMSERIMLISFTGRKSGKPYSTPVSYMRTGEVVTCFTDSGWGKSLIGGEPVTRVLAGQEVTGTAQATTEQERVTEGLRKMIQHDADDAKYFGVNVDSGGQPNEDDLRAAAAKTTMIDVRLNP